MKKVKSLTHLKNLAHEKKSVVCPKHPAWAKSHPAAFVINLSGFMLENLFSLGLFVYLPNKARSGFAAGRVKNQGSAKAAIR